MLALVAGSLRCYLRAVCMIAVIGGLGTWLPGRSRTFHIGAGGIVSGLAGHVVTMAFLPGLHCAPSIATRVTRSDSHSASVIKKDLRDDLLCITK